MADDARAEAIAAACQGLTVTFADGHTGPFRDLLQAILNEEGPEAAVGAVLDAIPTDVLARYVVELRLLAHAERLANDPEVWASVDEIERRLVSGEPLDDLLGPGISADEFRRQYLTEETDRG